MKGFAINNAPTDHGGVIPSTQLVSSQEMNTFVRAGDGHYCPKCKCWSTVQPSHSHVIFDGKPVAYTGDKLSCGARILEQQFHVVGDSQSSILTEQHISTEASVASLETTNILPSDALTQKAKITPNIHFPIMGILARLDRLDGKKINPTDKVLINGDPLKEVWITDKGVAYFIPSKNITEVKSIEINGELLNLEKSLRRFHSNKEGVDSISQQVDVLNQALKEHKEQFPGKDQSNIIVMQGAFRYSLILDYIDQLDWDYESQKYLLNQRLSLKTDF